MKTTLTLDASQISTYLKCPLMWYYAYHERLQLSSLKTEALDKGTLVHELLAIYYNLKDSSPCARDEAIETFKAIHGDIYHELEFMCNRFALYTERWKNSDFKVLTNNGIPGVEIGFSKLLYENDAVRFIVEGRIDLLSTIQGIPCFVDHKTQSKVNYLYHYTPQFKTYAWATGYRYGIINYFGLQQKYEEGKTFRQDLVSFNEDMILDWEKRLKRVFGEICIAKYEASFSSGEFYK